MAKRSALPELDRGALSCADLAYIEEPPEASPAQRVEAAIRAYLWALENTEAHALGTAYPSLNEYRVARAEFERGGSR